MPGVSSIIIEKLRDHNRFPQRVNYDNDQSRGQFFSTREGVLLSLESINEHYLDPSRAGFHLTENLFDVSGFEYKRTVDDILLDAHTHFVYSPVNR